MTKEKALKKLIGWIAAELFAVAVFVFVFDPFYQYHAPFFGMEAVLHDRDNQMPGTVRNFTYDGVLLGSSVMENCDQTYLDARYDTTSIKIARASGSVADLLYYLEMAQEEHTLKQVYWCLDLPSLTAPSAVTLQKGNDTPWYLHTRSVLDDIPYVYNKEILLEKIPYALAGAYLGKNTGGQAYNWAEGKVFGAESVMRVYDKPRKAAPEKDFSQDKEHLGENLELLARQITAHPDCTYRFFIPPFSMCWWDCAYVNGELEKNFYVLEETFATLLAFPNVKLYFYQGKEEIICNLDNYMDMIHYTPEINQYMLEEMCAGKGRVTAKNAEKTVTKMRKLVKKIIKKRIYEYYPKGGK